MEQKDSKKSKWSTPLWGSILTIIVGSILIIWPELALSYIVIVIGLLFLISGLSAAISYWANKNSDGNSYTYLLFTGIGSTLFGLWLILMPQFFVNILMFVMGGILVLAGIQQLGELIIQRKNVIVPFAFFILPTLVLLAGILILFNPFSTATSVVVIFGVSAVLYGIAGLINGYKAKKQPTF